MECGKPFSPYKTMIGSMIPNAIMECRELSSSAKLVWARLSQYCGRKNFCWPKQTTIADDVGISERQVRNILKELEEFGLIKIIPPIGEERFSHRSNRYKMIFHEIFECEPEESCCFGEEIDCRSEAEENFRSKERESYLRESYRNCFSKEKQAMVSDETMSSNSNQSGCSNSGDVAKTKKVLTRKLKQTIAKKTPQLPKISEDVQNLINFWNGLKIVQHKSPSAKVYQESAKMLKKLLNGKFFDDNSDFKKYAKRKFKQEEITQSMLNFSLAATNFDYEPVGDYKKVLKKTSLQNFLYNNMNRKSLFVEHFENPPKLLGENMRVVDDVDEDQTRILKDVYVKRVLGGIVPNAWSTFDENNFRKATFSLTTWFKNNIKNLRKEHELCGETVFHKRKRAELLLKAILHELNEDTSKVKTGWLCSPLSFSQRLSRYCFAQGILEE